ncbi:hypothetical protein FZEAL_10008 [Fusarium zealandicum]|uniref:Secreted protein n=1 Tax=Fusarium zealandicum TaxID=1053134 RepID=A0A8H4XD16_9HYPO|nr:hypothetical protein FZEAL_10008 [Fusarium zealandicum]
MGLLTSNAGRALLVSLILTVSLVAFFTPSIPETVSNTYHMAFPLRDLDVSLEQIQKSPPTVLVSVKNTRENNVTVLTYGSPLDPLAIQLGMLYITPEGQRSALEIQQLEVQRQWPPTEDALVQINAGETHSVEITIMEPVVPMYKLDKKARVQLSGKWQAVWPAEKSKIPKDVIEAGGTGEHAVSGGFSSNKIDIDIE